MISPCRIVKELCEKHLGMGEGKISDELISLRKYASSLALREPGNPSIIYNPEYTALSFRGQNLSFSRLQSGLNELIRDTWSQLLAFTKNKKIEVVLPPLMSEDVRSTAVGKSFIDNVTTDPPTLPLLSGMLECSGLPLLRPNGRVGDKETFEVDPSASEEFFHKVKPIVEAITFLVHTTSSGPLRLSEVVEDRYRNGSNQRNLLISHGIVFLIRRNLKSSTLRGHRSSVIHFPPEKVVELLVYYLAVFRPVEVFLAASLGWTDKHAAYAQFIHVVKGRKLRPQELTDIVARHTDRYFKCRLTGSQLRHVLINVQSVFLPPIVDPSVQKLGDSQAGHSSNVANRVYGQRIDHLPGEEAAAFTLAYHWCQRVHSLLGLGPEDPPVRPLPHLYASSQLALLSGHTAPCSPSSGEIMRQVHHALNSGFSYAMQELATRCEKAIKESVFQAIAHSLASTNSSEPATARPPSFVLDHPPVAPPAPDTVSSQPATFSRSLTSSLKPSVEPVREQPVSVISEDVLLRTLLLYTGKPGSTFTSQNQQLLLKAVLEGGYDAVIGILPTGSGKSIAIFGPVLAESSGISVVITCYAALRRQLAEQARSFGIDHLVWSDRNLENSPHCASVRLVIMITDDMSTDEAQRQARFI